MLHSTSRDARAASSACTCKYACYCDVEDKLVRSEPRRARAAVTEQDLIEIADSLPRALLVFVYMCSYLAIYLFTRTFPAWHTPLKCNLLLKIYFPFHVVAVVVVTVWIQSTRCCPRRPSCCSNSCCITFVLLVTVVLRWTIQVLMLCFLPDKLYSLTCWAEIAACLWLVVFAMSKCLACLLTGGALAGLGAYCYKNVVLDDLWQAPDDFYVSVTCATLLFCSILLAYALRPRPFTTNVYTQIGMFCAHMHMWVATVLTSLLARAMRAGATWFTACTPKTS